MSLTTYRSLNTASRLFLKIVTVTVLESMEVFRRMMDIRKGVEGIVLRKGGDDGRCGRSGQMVAVSFSTIRMWAEVLRSRMMWRGCVDKLLY
jgi:hypothetical protein